MFSPTSKIVLLTATFLALLLTDAIADESTSSPKQDEALRTVNSSIAQASKTMLNALFGGEVSHASLHLLQRAPQLEANKRGDLRVALVNASPSRSRHQSPSKIKVNFIRSPRVILATGVTARGNEENETLPQGSKIWNSSESWVSVKKWHPTGVVSNIRNSEVRWANVSYMSINELLVLAAVAYPAFVVTILLILTVFVSIFLGTRPEPSPARTEIRKTESGEDAVLKANLRGGVIVAACGTLKDPLYNPPVLPKDRLSTVARLVYNIWALFCCLIPCFMVFGMPLLMICLARPWPQEVFATLTLLTSAMIFTNGMYMAIFAGSAILRMRREEKQDGVNRRFQYPVTDSAANVVSHWVILPQYGEDVEIVGMALKSIASSHIAKSSINILLGMEEREGSIARIKAKKLEADFSPFFNQIAVSYHPADLPNDPPGKASNLAWSFKFLMRRLSESKEDMSKVVLTVADADSEFHLLYFDSLTQHFITTSEERRYKRIWQSPVFHVKNYHRQPSPVIVGTMFTCMQELAALCDPNAVRFPYSTYSLSLALARQVGGWDPDWIAEDYHMGIKCFLLTLGATTVEPILLPTVNYTPEADTWFSTVWARCIQAKRHALGFSDLSYYFMTLPLIFSYAVTQRSGIESLRAFWCMATYGVTLLIRLINIHVVIGVLSTYGLCTSLLKMLMIVFFSEDRNVNFLFTRTSFCPNALMVSSFTCTTLVSALFIVVYHLTKGRVEGQPDDVWKTPIFHWLRNFLSIIICGPFYFLGLGLCIWQAALSVAFSRNFEYEVAPKPVISSATASSSNQSVAATVSCKTEGSLKGT